VNGGLEGLEFRPALFGGYLREVGCCEGSLRSEERTVRRGRKEESRGEGGQFERGHRGGQEG